MTDKKHNPAFRSRAAVLAALLSGACSGGSQAPEPESLTPAAPLPATMVQGRATKGPIASAEVALFNVDGRGQALGPAVDSTLTDENGNWSFDLPADHPAYLVVVSGGRFVDESDTSGDTPRSIVLAASDQLLSVLPAGESSAAVTLLTHALVEKSRQESGDRDFLELLAGNQAQFSAAFGLDPLLTRSADPLAPAGTPDEQRYALLAGGAAYALNAVAITRGLPAADFATIELFARDLVDCSFDGQGMGGQTLYDFSPMTGRTLGDEILRFRNNNAEAYRNVPLPASLPGCPATPGTQDSTAPAFTSFAPPLLVGAASAQGVASDAPAIVAALANFAAIDDRDASPSIVADLPAMLPLGVNDVAVAAIDGWGNRAQASWQIDVADLDAPFIAAPADVAVAASAELTQVALGTPLVSDNVSAEATLSVVNDAPAEGFAPGAHVVTWNVTDEAGLSASASQQVVVAGGQPELLTPIPTLASTQGQGVNIDLSVYFSDPVGAPLSFTLAGLPAGSGLTLDAASGRLDGAPLAADLAAQPLALTVTASNGVFERAADWTLIVQPTVPEFTLTQTLIDETEDFAVIVIVDPIPVATPMGAGSISWSVAQTGGEPGIADVSIGATDGRVSVAAAADRYGDAVWRVTAENTQNGARYGVDLSVSIEAVNDAPRVLTDEDAIGGTASETFALDVASRFRDVDGDSLEYSVSGAPATLTMVDGVLGGVADELAAAGGQFDVVFTATDAAGTSAESRATLIFDIRDSDADGLSDSRELELGTNPDDADSDDDGVDDGAEWRAGADPLMPATAVIYLSTAGDNANGGSSFADALRSHVGVAEVPSGASAAQPTFILYAADEAGSYPGGLTLAAPCDHIVLLGSVDAMSGVTRAGASSSRLTAISQPSVSASGCNNLQLAHLTVADNKSGGLYLHDSHTTLRNVRLHHNFSEAPGAGIAQNGGQLEILGSTLAANESGGGGGAIHTSGDDAQLLVSDSRLTGNLAQEDGGAVLFDAPGGRLELTNLLASGNAARRGAAAYVAAGQASITSATLAFNYKRDQGDGGALDVAAPGSMTLADSLVWFTRDSEREASTLGPLVESNFNTMEQAPLGAQDLAFAASGPAFGQGYAVTAQSAALDNGSRSAAEAGLDRQFARSGDPFPDDGQLDRGVHQLSGATAPALDASRLGGHVHVDRAPTIAFARYRRLTVTPTMNGTAIGPGRRVRIAAEGDRSILANPANLFSDGQWLATDLGNGDYAVWIDARYVTQDVYRLTVDDTEATVSALRRCVLNACQGASGLQQGP